MSRVASVRRMALLFELDVCLQLQCFVPGLSGKAAVQQYGGLQSTSQAYVFH